DLTVRFRAIKEEITAALGMKFLAHEVLRDLSDLDLVIVPGGPGRAEVVKDREFLSELLNFGTEKPIASVCTGALILAAAGLLEKYFGPELAREVEDRIEYHRHPNP